MPFALALLSDSGSTKPWLMPALMLALVVGRWGQRPRQVSLTVMALVALVFSWAGDIVLGAPGGFGFLAGLGCFFVAHLVWILVFVRFTRERRIPAVAVVYLLWWVAFVALLAPFTGSLLVPVAVYGLALGSVGVLGLASNRLVLSGSLLFVVSDSLLALHTFLPNFSPWGIDAAIMACYLAAQGLIVAGVIRGKKREDAHG